MPLSLLEAALAYAERGWHVFPCKPRDKRPATPNGFKDATTDRLKIARWWAANPACNVAIATGAASGFFVLDVDAPEGFRSAATLTMQHGSLPHTMTQRTGGGGWQHLYAMPEGVRIGNSAGRLGAGLDVRGDGGYVVVAPSVHPSGNAYAWRDLNDEIAEPCAWLISLITETARPADTVIEAKLPTSPMPGAGVVRSYITGIVATLQAAKEGKRNNVLLWCAARMFDHGNSLADVEFTLAPIALQIGLSERETSATIKSAANQDRRPATSRVSSSGRSHAARSTNSRLQNARANRYR
jgi:hypothetical protein